MDRCRPFPPSLCPSCFSRQGVQLLFLPLSTCVHRFVSFFRCAHSFPFSFVLSLSFAGISSSSSSSLRRSFSYFSSRATAIFSNRRDDRSGKVGRSGCARSQVASVRVASSTQGQSDGNNFWDLNRLGCSSETFCWIRRCFFGIISIQ